ncbi:hypothetical protein ACW95P_04560 [Candidatus Mycoplasma pogonae]
MKKIQQWFYKDFNKIQWTKTIVTSVIGASLFITLFLLAFLWKKQTWFNSLSAIAAVFLGIQLFYLTYRLSLFQTTVMTVKNFTIRRHNKIYKDVKTKQKELWDAASYNDDLKAKAWTPYLLHFLIYIILIIVGVVVSHS